MAVIFSTISGTTNPAWRNSLSSMAVTFSSHNWNNLGLLKHLWCILSCMAVTSLSPFQASLGHTYPAWLSTFLNHPWDIPTLHGCQLFKHLWDILSCMAVSFSAISGTTYPAWLRTFQPSLEQTILHDYQPVRHLWDILS